MSHDNRHNILVIKLSALGDFIQALGAMRAIRLHHKGDHITLLTTKGLKDIAEKSGYFDRITIDDRPKIFQLSKLWQLRSKLNKPSYRRVYDLQNNDRTGLYFKLFKPKPEWVGIAKGASHRNVSQERTKGLAFDGHKQTLGLAGIKNIDVDNLSWIDNDIRQFNLPDHYALIVAGSAPQHPQKRWGEDNYAWLCQQLLNRNIQPVLIGTHVEESIAQKIMKSVPQTINLVGKTDLYDLPALARGCNLAIGNDTGPMHFIGASGAKTFVLFTPNSNPTRHKPLGDYVHALCLSEKSKNDVWEHIQKEI